ncbi:MAG TPA: hypothetical protein VEQ59_15100 [Polyangiaceae bacterium]|nr:hypothetical protein [Polyangiaceae bacterium]
MPVFGISRVRAAWLLAVSRLGSALAAGLLVMLWAAPSRAWYFPEHTELTRLGLQDYAPAFATAEINRVLADARALGLYVCPEANMPLAAVPASGDRVDCVPYGALAALAADHSNDVTELEAELTTPVSRLWPGADPPVALILTEAAQQIWVDFEKHAPIDVLRVWTVDVNRLSGGIQHLPTAINPHDYIRALDAQLLAIDRGYVSRAAGAKTHFHDPTRDLQSTLSAASLGELDNGLGQLMAHHARSLQLAALSLRAKSPIVKQRLRVEALLEHAFALHFMEDGLAAGHIATDPSVTVDERRAQRHDFFNRQGLAVTRAATGRRCNELSVDPLHDMGLFPCWTAHGDGFASAVDRLYVGEAAARLQTAFALALRGTEGLEQLKKDAEKESDCKNWLEYEESGKEASEPGVGCELAWTAFLLDPQPQWARRACADTEGRKQNRAWSHDIIGNFVSSAATLADKAPLRAADAGKAAPQLGTLPASVLGRPLGPRGACEVFTAGSLEANLWRPVLMAWPDAQTDVTTLEGADAFGRGLDHQVVASIGASYTGWLKDSATLTTWGGLGTGLAFSATNVFPYRKTRALLEANVGVAVGTLVAGTGPRFRTLGVAEIRAPVTTLLCYGGAILLGSRYPVALVGDRTTFGLLGGRLYLELDGAGARVEGWDVEFLEFVLGDSGQVTAAARSGFLDREVRFRLGVRSADPSVRLGDRSRDLWVISSEFNSGFFTSLFK